MIRRDYIVDTELDELVDQMLYERASCPPDSPRWRMATATIARACTERLLPIASRRPRMSMLLKDASSLARTVAEADDLEKAMNGR